MIICRESVLHAVALFAAIITGTASAQVWPNVPGPMQHVLITLDGNTINVEAPALTQPLPLRCYAGESYTAPADVLDGTCYNDQYGWLAGGFITLPDEVNSAIWIELIEKSPGLNTYEGGMRPMRANHTYAPIQGTNGAPARWKWSGNMTHNWYATNEPGVLSATYRVYVGDLNGAPWPGFVGDEMTLTWRSGFRPTPVSSTTATSAAAAICIVAGIIAVRSRAEKRKAVFV